MALRVLIKLEFAVFFSCDDHLVTVVLLIELCAEFHLPLWMSAVDFKKAFDSVEHTSLWHSLLEQCVEPAYVSILASLYTGRCGQVVGKTLSKPFLITRGTKQGDPISPMLFNSSLESIIGSLQPNWRKRGFGIDLGSPQGNLTNL